MKIISTLLMCLALNPAQASEENRPPPLDGGNETSSNQSQRSMWGGTELEIGTLLWEAHKPYPCRPLLSCRQVKGMRQRGGEMECFDRSWFICTKPARLHGNLIGRWLEVLHKRLDQCKVPGACGEKACMTTGEQVAIQLCEREFD